LQSAQAESGADKVNGQDESGYNEKFEDDGEVKGLDEDGQVEQDENTNRERGLSASPAQKNIGAPKAGVIEAHELNEEDEDISERALNVQMEKSQEEIQEQGYLQNFFECPYEYQKVIFMMVKGDQDGLSQSKLYLESQDIFNYYLQCIIEFSQ